MPHQAIRLKDQRATETRNKRATQLNEEKNGCKKLEARGRRSKASRYIVGKACSDYMFWEEGCYVHTLR